MKIEISIGLRTELKHESVKTELELTNMTNINRVSYRLLIILISFESYAAYMICIRIILITLHMQCIIYVCIIMKIKMFVCKHEFEQRWARVFIMSSSLYNFEEKHCFRSFVFLPTFLSISGGLMWSAKDVRVTIYITNAFSDPIHHPLWCFL